MPLETKVEELHKRLSAENDQTRRFRKVQKRKYPNKKPTKFRIRSLWNNNENIPIYVPSF